MSHNHLKSPRELRNKEIAQAVLTKIRTKNPDYKLGWVYDLLAKAAGFRNWNTAKALNVDFQTVIEKMEME